MSGADDPAAAADELAQPAAPAAPGQRVEWRNEVVAIESLPAVNDAPFERLDPRYLQQQRLIWTIVAVGLLAGVSTACSLAGAPGWVWALACAGPVAVGVAAWVLEGKAFDYRGVQLRERDVSARRGLISRSTTSVPFTRVQHVTVERGPLDRIFGLANVVVFTAGETTADARIAGLDPDRADRLREDIINRSSTKHSDATT